MSKNKDTIHQIYDRNYKRIFSNKISIKQFLENFVNIGLVKHIDFDNIEIILNKTFFSEELKKNESDIVYKIKLKGEYSDISLYIIILLEFQSEKDKEMLYRMIHYTNLLYKDLEKMNNGNMSPILPIVLYTGTGIWNIPTDLVQIVKGIEILGEYGLKFKYFLLDVNKYEPKELQKIGNIISTLFLAEIVKDKELIADEIEKLLTKKEDEESLKNLLKYLLEVYKRDNIDYNRIQEVLDGKLRAGTMLIEHVMELEKEAEKRGEQRGEKRGEKRGEQIGIAKGELKYSKNKVLKLLTKKFVSLPPEIEDKIRNCSDISKLDNIIDNIFDISSIIEIERLLL